MKRVDAIHVVKTGAIIATGAASVNVAIPTASSNPPLLPYYVRVSATTASYIKIGKGAQTAVAGDLMVQPGESVILATGPNIDNIAALQVLAAGTVQISPMEDQ
jgi:hypothetical protein